MAYLGILVPWAALQLVNMTFGTLSLDGLNQPFHEMK
jgi:hypothetical protein